MQLGGEDNKAKGYRGFLLLFYPTKHQTGDKDMSLEAYKWAKSVRGLPPLEKWLLVTIADFFNEEDHVAWPGRARLSEETGISIRQITRLLTSLNERGFIRIQRWINNANGQNLSNRYFLPIYDPKGSAADTREIVIVDPSYDWEEAKVIFLDEFKERHA